MNVWWVIGLRLECVSTFFLSLGAENGSKQFIMPSIILGGLYTAQQNKLFFEHLPIMLLRQTQTRREIEEKTLTCSRYIARFGLVITIIHILGSRYTFNSRDL